MQRSAIDGKYSGKQSFYALTGRTRQAIDRRPLPRTPLIGFARRVARCTWRIGTLLLMCALASCGTRTARLSPLSADAAILAYGDSLTFGTGASPETSYPAVLETLVGRKVWSAGVPGELSAAGLARLPSALEYYQPKLLIL